MYARYRWASYRAVSERVPALVDMVLERLASQKELAVEGAGADGTAAAAADDPFLFLPNLRDDVLRSVHSPAQRDRIWSRVRAVVEQNSNVRTGQRESRDGEIGRAWEWIGTSGAEAVHRRRSRLSGGGRVSWAPETSLMEDERDDSIAQAAHRKWDEARPVY